MTLNPVKVVQARRNKKLQVWHEQNVLKDIMFKIDKNLKKK